MVFSALDLEVAAGERFGLFGPNGAGKTTLMNCMTGLLSFHEGSISLLGNRILPHQKSFNRLFGFVPQDFSFYQELTPVENLELVRKGVEQRIQHRVRSLAGSIPRAAAPGCG